MKTRVCASTFLAVFLLTSAGQALASTLVQKGHPAPATGLLFNEPEVKRLVEDLRDLRTARAKVETQAAEIQALRAQVTALQTAVGELKEATRARETALALADDREKRRTEDEARLMAVMRQMGDALERSSKALDRAEARIESLEKRQFWLMLLGPVALVVGILLR